MNKVLIGLNIFLIAAVAFLFFKISSVDQSAPKGVNTGSLPEKKAPVKTVEQVGNVPTGKIAYVNIDKLNEESLEIEDLIAESKRRKSNIEASVENLSMQYQK